MGKGPWSVTLADVDEDGDTDVITANYFDDSVTALLNSGQGAAFARLDFNVGDSPTSVAVRDLDGDFDPDIVAVNSAEASITVLTSRYGRTDYPVGTSPQGVTLADVDGDRDADLVLANSIAPGCTILLNNGAGVFGSRVDYDVRDANQIAVTDLDRDGRVDLVTSTVNVLFAIR